MGLKTMVEPTLVVDGTDGQLTVRGLSLKAMSVLVQTRGDGVARLYALYADKVAMANAGIDDGISGLDLNGLASDMMGEFPDIMAMAIALADTDFDIDAVDFAELHKSTSIAMNLPLPVQFDALQKIGLLTFKDSSPKKVVETVMGVVHSTLGVVAQLRVSATSSLASSAK